MKQFTILFLALALLVACQPNVPEIVDKPTQTEQSVEPIYQPLYYPNYIDDYTGPLANVGGVPYLDKSIIGWSWGGWGLDDWTGWVGGAGDLLAITASCLSIYCESRSLHDINKGIKTLDSALQVCDTIQKYLCNFDDTIRRMTDTLNAHFDRVDQQILDQTQRLRLFTKRQRLQSYIMLLNQQQLRSEPFRNDTFVVKVYEDVKNLYHNKNSIKRTDLEDFLDKHYQNLYTWMGPDNARYTALMSYMDWAMSATDGVANYDALQAVDNIVREMAAWEHETYPIRSSNYVYELSRTNYVGNVMLAFLFSCAETGRPMPNPYADPDLMRDSLAKKLQKYVKFINSHLPDPKIRNLRICLIDGMHYVVDSIIYPVDYTTSRSWITQNCTADTLIYSLLGENGKTLLPEETRSQQLTVSEADALFNFYNIKSGTLIDSILIGKGKLLIKGKEDKPHYLLLNGPAEKIAVNGTYKVSAPFANQQSKALADKRYVIPMGDLKWENGCFTGWKTDKAYYRLQIYR